MDKNVHLNLLWKNIYFQIVVENSLVESYSNIHLNNSADNKLVYKLASYKLAHSIYVELRNIYPGLALCGIDINQSSSNSIQNFNLTILALGTIQLSFLWDNAVNSTKLVNRLHYNHEMVKLPIIAPLGGDYVIALPKCKDVNLYLNFANYMEEVKLTEYCLKLIVELNNGESQELFLSHSLVAQLFAYYKLTNNVAENDPDTCYLIKKIEQFLKLLWQSHLKITQWHFVLLNKKNCGVTKTRLGTVKGEVFYQTITKFVREIVEEIIQLDPPTNLGVGDNNFNIPVTIGETYLTLDLINQLEIGDVIIYPEANTSLQLGQHVLVMLKEKKDGNKLIVNEVLYHD